MQTLGEITEREGVCAPGDDLISVFLKFKFLKFLNFKLPNRIRVWHTKETNRKAWTYKLKNEVYKNCSIDFKIQEFQTLCFTDFIRIEEDCLAFQGLHSLNLLSRRDLGYEAVAFLKVYILIFNNNKYKLLISYNFLSVFPQYGIIQEKYSYDHKIQQNT